MHKLITLFLISGTLIFSSVSHAKIEVFLDQNVSPIAINGEKTPIRLTKKSNYEFNNGTNQIVIKMEALVRSSNGDFEKFNSEVVIMTFDAADQNLILKPNFRVKNVSDAKEFNKHAQFTLIDKKTNKNVTVKQEFLPDAGGIMRDYELEVARYNVKNKIALSDASIAVLQIENKDKIKMMENDDGINTMKMVEHWYSKASEKERTEFTELAFQSRKNNINLDDGNESKALDMMVHWYNESTDEQKKSVISWLFEK